MNTDTFQGFAIKSPDEWTKFEKTSFPSKKMGSHDVEIKIHACGVCGSDVHTITGGWGEAPFPLVVGHEIVGVATDVGPEVKGIKKGDRVGVGAQVWSCGECVWCKSDNENYCPKQVDTYGANYPDSSYPNAKALGLNGEKTMGGYANAIRTHQQFVFPIPDNLSFVQAAPMLCAGLTVYSPLVRNGTGPGKKVGIVGIGGLGHYAVQFAKALGAEVYAISHSPSKEADAKAMGADHFVNTNDKDWAEPLAMSLDFILSTNDDASNYPLADYFSLLKVEGAFHTVGLPNKPLPEIKAQMFAGNACKLQASHIGSKKEALDMLKLAGEKGVKTWAMELPMTAENCGEAVRRVKYVEDVKYRFVLTNADTAFDA